MDKYSFALQPPNGDGVLAVGRLFGDDDQWQSLTDLLLSAGYVIHEEAFELRSAG